MRSAQHTRNAAGPAAVRKKLGQRDVLRKRLVVLVGPGGEELVHRRGLDQRPDAAAEARPKGRGGRSAQPPGRGGQKHRLRHLIAQQTFGAVLRTIDQPAERPQVAAGQGIARRGNDLAALDHEMLEPGQQGLGRERAGRSAVPDQRLEPVGGVGRTAQGGRQVRIVAAGLAPPQSRPAPSRAARPDCTSPAPRRSSRPPRRWSRWRTRGPAAPAAAARTPPGSRRIG